MAYIEIRPQLKAQKNLKNNFWSDVVDNIKKSFAENEAKNKAKNESLEKEFSNALNSIKQSSNDRKTSEKMTDAMKSGRTITLNQPKSQRFTFVKQIADDSPKLHNFKIKTEAEKQSLSPAGFFRIGELPAERERLTERREKAAADKLGHDLTEDQKELVKLQAEDVPVNEAEIPSTAIKKIKYNPKTQALYVTFVGSNKKYFYPRVPQKRIEELMEAPSKGEYFIRNIHDVYTLNPGHKPSNNQAKNKVVKNYYKKMQKYYKNVMTKGHM